MTEPEPGGRAGSAPTPTRPGSWDDAPCSLFEVDERGVIVAANARLISRLGYRSDDLVDIMRWPQLLAIGSRIFAEAQLGPILTLNRAQDEVMVELRCADGSRLPALLNVETIVDSAGVSRGARFAAMTVPDRRAYEESLRSARRLAEEAGAVSAATQQRLQVRADADAALTSTTDLEETLERFAQVLQDAYAEWCVVFAAGPDHDDVLARCVAVHRDATRLPALRLFAGRLGQKPSQVTQAVQDGAPRLLATSGADRTGPDDVRPTAEIDVTSMLVVPATAHRRMSALIVLGRGETTARFTEQDLRDVTDIAARAGIALDNLRLYAREHAYSVQLQQALLTTPPEQPDVSIETRYQPAWNGAEIGGDWYDAFRQRDGSLVLTIGDVMGHDVRAAASMGQLRGVIRTAAHLLDASPAATLAAADRTARGLEVGAMATAVVARLCTAANSRSLQWSNAGHPSPVLVGADGLVRLLDEPPDPPLGVVPDVPRHDHEAALVAGDTVVFYTDGLIERRGVDLEVSMDRLLEALADAHLRPASEVCDELVTLFAADRDDDVALLLIRIS